MTLLVTARPLSGLFRRIVGCSCSVLAFSSTAAAAGFTTARITTRAATPLSFQSRRTQSYLVTTSRRCSMAPVSHDNKNNNRKRGIGGQGMKQTSLWSSFGGRSSSSSTGGKQNESSAVPSTSTTVSTTTTNSNSNSNQKEYQIYCDLDGVLCDFDAGVQALTGKSPEQLQQKNSSFLWSAIAKAGAARFYEHLPWCHDGQRLWETIRPCTPHILTGVSRGAGVAAAKFAWCQRELCVEVYHVNMAGPKYAHALQPSSNNNNNNNNNNGKRRKEGVTNVITCWTKNKHLESGPGRVLIDDREALRSEWEAAGGIFIWHTSVDDTLQQLRRRGIVKDDDAAATCLVTTTTNKNQATTTIAATNHASVSTESSLSTSSSVAADAEAEHVQAEETPSKKAKKQRVT